MQTGHRVEWTRCRLIVMTYDNTWRPFALDTAVMVTLLAAQALWPNLRCLWMTSDCRAEIKTAVSASPWNRVSWSPYTGGPPDSLCRGLPDIICSSYMVSHCSKWSPTTHALLLEGQPLRGLFNCSSADTPTLPRMGERCYKRWQLVESLEFT